ncbi:MAG: DISARM system phospholipase D-like protein DrmC [Myxococcota bacterium]|nr:DISARM system phospholipase D-like protein DrmC [Myxococcota bacterium]
MSAGGLSDLASFALENVQRLVARGPAASRLSPEDLRSCGLPTAAAEGLLSQLEAGTVGLLIEAVLAERVRPVPAVELVWTGPEAKVSTARDTAVIVRALLRSAKRLVVIGGYRFDHGAELLAPLHEAMSTRGVRACIFIDVPSGGLPPRERAQQAVDQFFASNWPFPSQPEVYVDGRALSGAWVNLHAKCVVVDESTTLVTSANFTQAGQTRNVEVGVLIEDPALASSLAGQWIRGVLSGHFVRLDRSR